jgi:hypothetical protein
VYAPCHIALSIPLQARLQNILHVHGTNKFHGLAQLSHSRGEIQNGGDGMQAAMAFAMQEGTCLSGEGNAQQGHHAPTLQRAESMTPRVRLYVEQEALNGGVSADDVMARVRKHAVAAVRRRVIVRLYDDGFKASQIAYWLGLKLNNVLYHLNTTSNMRGDRL